MTSPYQQFFTSGQLLDRDAYDPYSSFPHDDREALGYIASAMFQAPSRPPPFQMKQYGPLKGQTSSEALALARAHLGPTYQPPSGPVPSIPTSKSRSSTFSSSASDFYRGHRPSQGSTSSSYGTASIDSGTSHSSHQLHQVLSQAQFPSPPPSFGFTPRSSARNSMASSSATPISWQPRAVPYQALASTSIHTVDSRAASPEPSLASPTTQSSIGSSLPATPQMSYSARLHPNDSLKAASNWPPFGSPPSSASVASSFTFPKKAKKTPKKTRIAPGPQGNSFLNMTDDSEDEDTATFPQASGMPGFSLQKSPKRVSMASRGGYSNPSLDVPRDVDLSSNFGFSTRSSRSGSHDATSSSRTLFPSFQQPPIVEDDRLSRRSVYSSFSQQSKPAPTMPYSYASDSHPYHSSLRETLAPSLDSYAAYLPSTSPYNNALLSPASTSYTFLSSEAPSLTRTASFRSDGRSMRSEASSSKLGSKMKSLLKIGKKQQRPTY